MRTNTHKRAAGPNSFGPVLDAAQSIFFSRELESIETTLHKTKYPELEAEMLLPQRKQLPAGVDTYTWRLFDERGLAVPMAGHEDGAPTSDVDGDEQSTKMVSWAAAYGYNVEEIAAAAHAGMPLDSMRADAARRKLAIALNTMALMGYAPKGILGLFTQTGTLTYTVPANGTGSSTLWSTKSADNVLADMFGMVDAMPNSTLDIEGGAGRRLSFVITKPNLRLISTLRLGTSAQDTTVLEFFRRQRPNVSIMGANYLGSVAGVTNGRMIVYDPAQVLWLGSIPFEQMPIEQKGFRFVINARARGGGVVTAYPKSIVYGDGAGA